MYLYWFMISLSWLGTVSLQYITKNGPQDSVLEFPNVWSQSPLPYMKFYNSRNDIETFQNFPLPGNFDQIYEGKEGVEPVELQRKRRTAAVIKTGEPKDRVWMPNLIDTDKTTYLGNDERLAGSPFVIQSYAGTVDANASDTNTIEPVDKKSFSPWGGKRDIQMPFIEHMWTWKRAANLREPTMPKRVRFSPWGGKRSGQLIYKPGGKTSKIILSQSIPELTRFVSNYPIGDRFNMAGFQLLPSTLHKRHPVRVLALSTKFDDRRIREGMPFNAFYEVLPKLFKHGHPYADINLNKDGKRKVKFSAWGGKRSPPIIGPIWTPAPQNIKDTTLDAILLIRNQRNNDKQKTL